MNPVREYAEQWANDDVRATMAWLDKAGFEVTEFSGGKESGFGDLLLVFSAGASVRIVRDRAQWDIGVSPGPQWDWLSLAVIAAAIDDGDLAPPARDDLSSELPHQLPKGIVWRDTLPRALEWLERPGSLDKVAATNARAYEARRRFFEGR